MKANAGGTKVVLETYKLSMMCLRFRHTDPKAINRICTLLTMSTNDQSMGLGMLVLTKKKKGVRLGRCVMLRSLQKYTEKM